MVGKTGFASDVTRSWVGETPEPSAESRAFLRGRWGAGRRGAIAGEDCRLEVEREPGQTITAACLSCARRWVSFCGQVSEPRERLWTAGGTVIGG